MNQPAENVQLQPARPSKLVLILVLIGLLAIAIQWFSTRQRFNAVEKSLSHQLDDQRTTNQQSLTLAKQAEERSLQANARTVILEQKLADSQNQQETLQTLYDELAGNQEKSVITEVEQLLTLANQQLQLANNIKSALTAMQTADARLQNIESSPAKQLRIVIAQDMQRLQNAPNVDVTGMSIKLNQLATSIDFLPLLSEAIRDQVSGKPSFSPPVNSSASSQVANAKHPVNILIKFGSEFWQDIKNLIKITRIDQNDVALLAPNQVFYVRENIKLRLLTARIALLQRDQATYNADLQLVDYAIRQHFLTHDQRTETALNSLHSLTASNIVIETPDVTASLNMAIKYKLSLESSPRERQQNRAVRH